MCGIYGRGRGGGDQPLYVRANVFCSVCTLYMSIVDSVEYYNDKCSTGILYSICSFPTYFLLYEDDMLPVFVYG